MIGPAVGADLGRMAAAVAGQPDRDKAHQAKMITNVGLMKRDREIEILFRRLRLYDQLGRRAEGLNPAGVEGAP